MRFPCDSHGKCQKLARRNGFEPLTPRFIVWGCLTKSEALEAHPPIADVAERSLISRWSWGYPRQI